jgi:hypothetical protein
LQFSVNEPLSFAGAQKDGEPIEAEAVKARLIEEWEKHSKIARLPLASEQGVTIEQRWSNDRVREMLRKSAPDATIRILITFFVHDLGLLDMLSDLLINSNRKVEILMMDPSERNRPILEKRYGDGQRELREGLTATTAAARINAQLDDLERRQERLKTLAEAEAQSGKARSIGSLEVLVYESVPTLVSYQIQDEMLVALLLTHKAFDDGPMIKIKKGEPLWDIMEDNWTKCREFAHPPDKRKPATATTTT